MLCNGFRMARRLPLWFKPLSTRYTPSTSRSNSSQRPVGLQTSKRRHGSIRVSWLAEYYKGYALVYLIALIMGCFICNNGLVQKQTRSFAGMGYSNATLGLLSELGGLGGWFCVLPAAYFVGSADGNGFVQGLLFCLASFGGAVIAPFVQIPGLNYLLSSMTLFVNIGLATLVYFMTRA